MEDTLSNYRGQTSLKRYLCVNRGVEFSDDLDVHHIDGNHSNYKDDNLALVPHKYHVELHNDCKDTVLSEIRDETYIGGPGNITLDDLSSNIDSIIRKRYVQLLKDRVKYVRKDS